MRCSPKSTTWLVSAAIALATAGFGRTVPSVTEPAEPAVRRALIGAVKARLGEAARVELQDVRVYLSVPRDMTGATATVEPGSRLGRPVRFTLTAVVEQPGGRQGVRAGSALATVRVSIPHVRTTTDVARGVLLAAADLAVVDGDIDGMPMEALPSLDDLVGARTTRQLQAGEIVTRQLVRMPPLVKSGDRVRTRAVIGGVEVTGFAVAQQNGHRHDRVRLVNPDSRRRLTGIVVGPGEVEVYRET